MEQLVAATVNLEKVPIMTLQLSGWRTLRSNQELQFKEKGKKMFFRSNEDRKDPLQFHLLLPARRTECTAHFLLTAAGTSPPLLPGPGTGAHARQAGEPRHGIKGLS